MKLAVLASPRSWYLQDLRRAAAGRHEVVALSFSQLAANASECWTGPPCARQVLTAFDALVVRSMPPGSLEQVVFRMDVLGRAEAAGVCVVNPPRALEIAVDKYLASAKLRAAGLLVPPTCVCQTVEEGLAAFESLGGDVVVKPLFGSEGRGITRVTDPAVALRVFTALVRVQAVLYLQQFISHPGYDYRLLVLGERVLAIRRSNPNDWRTNVARGATAEAFNPRDEMVWLARQAAQAVGALWAGVDLLPSRDGRLYVLEINAVPGWRAVAAAHQIDVAAIAIGELEELANRPNRSG